MVAVREYIYLHLIVLKYFLFVFKNVASKIFKIELMKTFLNQMSGVFPDMSVVKSILKLIWASSLGHFQLLSSPLEEIESAAERFTSKPPDAEDLQGCTLMLYLLFTVKKTIPFIEWNLKKKINLMFLIQMYH